MFAATSFRPLSALLPCAVLLLTAACTAQAPRADSDAAQRIDLLVEGDYVLTMDGAGPPLRGAAVAVDDGVIVAVGPADELRGRYRADTVLDGGSRLVMPGLVNGHTHAAMTLLRGIADDLELMEWLQKYIFPAEVQFVDAEFVRVGTELACREMIRGGTTTFVDMYYFPDAVAETVERCGLRAVVVPSVIDQQAPDAADGAGSLAKASDFARRWKGRNSRIVPAIGAHSVYTLSPEWLTRIRDAAAAAGVPVAIHVSESPFEISITRDNFGMTPVELLDDLGFFANHTIAAHVVWPTTDDDRILRANNVGVIHNPTSNMKISSGIAPVARLRSGGIHVGLGTDGAASNNDLDLFGEMRTAALLAKGVAGDARAADAATVLRMATLNGARALGLGEETGSLEVGKWADLCAVALDEPETRPLYHPISQLVYATSRHQVTDVWVGGEHVVKDRALTRLDEEAVLHRAGLWEQRLKAWG